MGKRRSRQKTVLSNLGPIPSIIACPSCGKTLARRDAAEHFKAYPPLPCKGFYDLPSGSHYIKIYQGGRVSPR